VALLVGDRVEVGDAVAVALAVGVGESVAVPVGSGGSVGTSVAVGLAVGDEDGVGVALGSGSRVGVGLGTAVVASGVGTGQPSSAAAVPRRISSTVTSPSPPGSNPGHVSMEAAPRAMLTPVTISSTVTSPSPSQSPTQPSAGAATRATAATSSTNGHRDGGQRFDPIAASLPPEPRYCHSRRDAAPAPT